MRYPSGTLKAMGVSTKIWGVGDNGDILLVVLTKNA